MKGETILSAYTKACVDTLNEKEWRQRETFEAELKRRLAVADTCRVVWAAQRGTPEQIVTALFCSVEDVDGFFSALVSRLRTDQAQIESQKAEIAELKAQLKSAWQTDAP